MLSNVANPVFHFEFNKKPYLLLRMDQYCIIILKLKIFNIVCVLYYQFFTSVPKLSLNFPESFSSNFEYFLKRLFVEIGQKSIKIHCIQSAVQMHN